MELDLLNSRDKKLPLTAHIQNLGFVWKVERFVFWVIFVKHEANRFQKPKLRFMREPLCNIFQPIFPKDFFANFGVLKLNWIRGILFLNSFGMFSRKWLFHWRFCSGSKRFSLPRLNCILGHWIHWKRVRTCWFWIRSIWLWICWNWIVDLTSIRFDFADSEFICRNFNPRTIRSLTTDFASTWIRIGDFWFRFSWANSTASTRFRFCEFWML